MFELLTISQAFIHTGDVDNALQLVVKGQQVVESVWEKIRRP
jgi:hypothetical protein